MKTILLICLPHQVIHNRRFAEPTTKLNRGGLFTFHIHFFTKHENDRPSLLKRCNTLISLRTSLGIVSNDSCDIPLSLQEVANIKLFIVPR